MILGITGGIATGKSTVSEMFLERGCFVLDADQLSREVVEPGSEGLSRVVKYFGTRILTSDRHLNRGLLAQIIFADEKERNRLNQLLHPLIFEKLQDRTRVVLDKDKEAIVIWNVALLIEEEMTSWVDKVLVVYATPAIQLQRLMERDALSKEEAMRRIQAQMAIAEKIEQAHFVVDNSGSYEETEKQVEEIWGCLQSENGSSLLD